jgi:hypothetical protein
MDWDAIAAAAEILAAVGVIVSLLYLGRQIRNQTLETRLTFASELVNQLNLVYSDLSTDAQLSELWVKGLQDFSALSPPQRARFSAFAGRLLRIVESVFHQYRWGRIDDTVWCGIDTSVKDLYLYPGMKDWWGTRAHWFSEEFNSHIKAYVADDSSTGLYGE